MKVRPSRGRSGFTLVELLTVVAIIMLLIGILIPALSAARTQAKNAATAGVIKAMMSGAELFQGDFKHYPQSRGYNPFEDDGSTLLTGAQWLGLQLVGPDGLGFVDPSIKNDTNNDGKIDGTDWVEWYDRNATREYSRQSLYAEVDGGSLASPDQIAVNDPGMAPGRPVTLSNIAGGSGNWHNGRVPMFVDAFGVPLLYYRANQQVTAPFTTGTPGSGLVVGRYDQADNAYLTGSDDNQGRYPVADGGWDFSGAGDQFGGNTVAHALGVFGYDPSTPNKFPEPKTFAEFFTDPTIFDRTVDSGGNNGRIWPHRPDTYVLISAGVDTLYGTSDDITNFSN